MAEKSLTDVVTRYEALQDLREVWQLGLQTLNKIQPQYRSKADEILEKSLTAALELIDKQIENMSSYDMKKFQVMRMIDGLPSSGDSIELGEREEELRKRRQAKNSPLQH